jgi:hypothetical protein
MRRENLRDDEFAEGAAAVMRRPNHPLPALEGRPPRQKPIKVELGSYTHGRRLFALRLVIRADLLGALVNAALKANGLKATLGHGGIAVIAQPVPTPAAPEQSPPAVAPGRRR